MPDFDNIYQTDLPDIRTLEAKSLMTKRDEDSVAVLMACDGIEDFYGVALVLSPIAARRFAAELLNIADDIEGL